MRLAKLGRVQATDLRRIATLQPEAHGTQDRKRFYDSALWQRARKAKLARDPLCQACAARGNDNAANHVDHWKPLAEGGHPTHSSNLVSLCESDHSRKTMSERNGTAPPKIVASAEYRVSIA